MPRRAVRLERLLGEVLRVPAVGRPAVLRDVALQPQEGALPFQRERIQRLLAQLQDARAVV